MNSQIKKSTDRQKEVKLTDYTLQSNDCQKHISLNRQKLKATVNPMLSTGVENVNNS